MNAPSNKMKCLDKQAAEFFNSNHFNNVEASLTSTFQTQMDNMVARVTKRVRFANDVNGEGAETQNA
ncbi:hypothetical protein THAR02_09582 [Trichoderma harzianum]|uniref:Uncharacterized protein n=1 Tax=Trichoderma harzianum TaxID=5544 RepID=A0A0F9ZYL8_TRIHA|nr:hypothetical protein THAR02_09582 [Trichoderma harzianum]